MTQLHGPYYRPVTDPSAPGGGKHGLDCGECKAYVVMQKNDRAGLEPAAARNCVIHLINAALRAVDGP